MIKYLICLTIDIDPDGLSGIVTDRNTSSFKSFEKIQSFPEIIQEELQMEIPLTWFIRIDEQIAYFFGDKFYLLNKYQNFWDEVEQQGHELAWHPHIYQKRKKEFIIPDDMNFVCDQLAAVHSDFLTTKFRPGTFRNGEGWHCNETMQMIENLGFSVDSTAIPGISKSPPHLLNWEQSPNQPYFPSKNNYRVNGEKRKLLEIPMNTWMVKAPYDNEPRLRYMNPCIFENVFKMSLQSNHIVTTTEELKVLTLISHPDEMAEQASTDLLYARSIKNYITNIKLLLSEIKKNNGNFEFLTMENAGLLWRKFNNETK